MFSKDSTSIIIKNIEEVSLLQVKNLYKQNPDSNKLISVFITPTDQDSLQMESEIIGTTKIVGDSLVFTPQTAFIKGKTYLVESYIDVDYASTSKMLTGKIKQNVRPQQQMLTR